VLEKSSMLDLMKIRPLGAELFRADGRTDGSTDRQTDRQTGIHDEANSRFSQFCECAKKKTSGRIYLGTTRGSQLMHVFIDRNGLDTI
jgi:hypothetical protein